MDHHERIELLGTGIHPPSAVDGGQNVVDAGLQTVARVADDPLEQRPGDAEGDRVHLGGVVRAAPDGRRRGRRREDVGDELEFRRAHLADPMEQGRQLAPGGVHVQVLVVAVVVGGTTPTRTPVRRRPGGRFPIPFAAGNELGKPGEHHHLHVPLVERPTVVKVRQRLRQLP